MLNLPDEVWQGDQDEQGDACCCPLVEEHASLRGQQQGCEHSEEEEGHRRLVQEAKTGGEAEEEPQFARATTHDEDEGEEAYHPEVGFDRVHGEEAVCAEVLRRDEYAYHR